MKKKDRVRIVTDSNIIYDYIPPKDNVWVDISKINLGADQDPFKKIVGFNDGWSWTIDEKLHSDLLARLDGYVVCLRNKMIEEFNTMLAEYDCETIGVEPNIKPCEDSFFYTPTEQCRARLGDWNERTSPSMDLYLRLNKNVTEIFLKYARPKLYKSLFYAYCELYDQAKDFMQMHAKVPGKVEQLIQLLSDAEKNGIARCRTMAKRCSKIQITVLRIDNETIIKEVTIHGSNKNSARMPEGYLPIALIDLRNSPSLKWMLKISGASIILTEGADFEEAKKWLEKTLKKGDSYKSYDMRFAKSLNGLYRYIMDIDIAKHIIHPIYLYHRKSSAIKMICSFLELPSHAERVLTNYIGR